MVFCRAVRCVLSGLRQTGRTRGDVGRSPKVDYPPPAEDTQADAARARFEITVPTADAAVWFDGVRMTQTGLTRVFVTPPLAEGKMYSATIEAKWIAEDGAKLSQKKVFDFMTGEKRTHTFREP